MKQMKAIFLCMLIIGAVILSGVIGVSAEPLATTSVKSGEIPYESYTYWEDFGSSEKTAAYCKPMYKVDRVITGKSVKSDSFETISDIYTDNGDVYVLDSKSGQITVLDSNYSLKRDINGIYLKGERQDITGASGMFVKNGKIYIADTQNGRILILDTDGRVTDVLNEPESSLIPEGFHYSPVKIAVDSKNYTYIVSDGSYYGALVYSPEMEFMGFYGANTVKATVGDVVQKFIDKIFSNDTKKGSAVLALPYQFNDLVVGVDDFIYTTTGNTGDSSQTGQVCKMNPGGRDVLHHKDFNFLDTVVGVYKGSEQKQNITGIAVDDDGFFYVVDSTYGRVYWYDRECNLLCVFGGSLGRGTQKGTFQLADCISLCGNDVLIGDSLRGTVTVFTLTEYGRTVRTVQLKTLNDDFDKTVEEWNGILEQDCNCQLAYRGLAAAYYTAKDNEAAIKYAKLGTDRALYAEAFSKQRQTFLENHFPLIFFAVILFAVLVAAISIICKRKSIKLIKNEKLCVAFYNVFHPFEGARLVKEKKAGSVIIAAVILGVWYVFSTIGDTASGFAFNYFDSADYNSFYILLSTVGLVSLWTVSNWLVCVLLGGTGKMKEIFTITCYALIPLIFSSALSLLLSHILVPKEFVFDTNLQTVCLLYTIYMLKALISKIHDYEFGKFFGTTLLTIASMLIIVFLIFLIFLLVQQVYGWFSALFTEAIYR